MPPELKFVICHSLESGHTIIDELDEVPPDGTFQTPLSDKPFRIEDAQEHRLLIAYRDQETTIPLKREQFETLYQRISESPQPFDLDRLPADAEPYATILSIHPRFEIDQREGVLKNTDSPTPSSLVDASLTVEKQDHEPDRKEPDLPVYSDSLLLIDALERYEPTALETMETAELVNLYTLCSDVQRNADDLRQNVRSLLLDRLYHDQPVYGQYGSVQRTSRRNRTLKDDQTVLELLEVTDLSESDLYEIDESQYVRKADVDEERKESRLQGLKDQLAAVDDPQTEELQDEIEELEARIEDLTSFSSASQVD